MRKQRILKERPKGIIKEKIPKGMIDIGTYDQLKGILDTGKIVIERIPLERAKKIDIETVKHLESLTENAISILENTNVWKPIKRTELIKKIEPKMESTKRDQEIREFMTIMKDELIYADKLVKDCDPRSIQVMSKIGRHIEKYKDLSSESGYQKLFRNSKMLEKYFIDLCECKPLIIRKK